jgi:hypothetical protein
MSMYLVQLRIAKKNKKDICAISKSRPLSGYIV